MDRREFLATTAAVAAAPIAAAARPLAERRLLYIAQPGIRNYPVNPLSSAAREILPRVEW